MRFPDPPRIFALLTITDFPVGPDTGNAEQERDYLVNSNRQLRHVQQAHARILVNLHASDPPQ